MKKSIKTAVEPEACQPWMEPARADSKQAKVINRGL
jgi:hypothetical protein